MPQAVLPSSSWCSSFVQEAKGRLSQDPPAPSFPAQGWGHQDC